MYLLTIITRLLIVKQVFSYGYPKCCKINEYLKEMDSGYQCTKNGSKRLQILSNETNFLESGVNGECLEVTADVFIFKVKDGQSVEGRPFKEPSFPKCCPLNYTYNSVLHSCEENPKGSHGYIREAFVEVGLPDCKIIVDNHLDEETDLYKSIIDVQTQSYCVDENEKGSFTKRECREDTEVCKDIRCVKKCCPDGKSYIKGLNCVDNYTNGLDLQSSPNVENPEDPFAIIINTTCEKMYLMEKERHSFSLSKNGTFQYFSHYHNSCVSEDVNKINSYCFEHIQSYEAYPSGFYLFKCLDEIQVEKKFIYPLVPKLLSCVFLILTIIVYLLIGVTKNLFRQIFMNYCISELFLFSFLYYTHRNLAPSDFTCKYLAYSLIYLSTATFAWLNVLCCDTWRTLGSCIPARQNRKDFKKMVYYLLYGWGMPTLLTLMIFFVSENNFLPLVVHPFVGSFKCLIEDRPNNYGSIIFLRLPHLLMQLVNTVLFIKTIVHCWRVRKEINEINDTTSNMRKKSYGMDKERLALVLKLAVMMGATYIFNVFSGFVKLSEMGVIAEYTELIWNCINDSQGVFVFIIFIWKKRIYYDILEKIKLIARICAKSNPSSSPMPLPKLGYTKTS